jgi:photosystem II stability/assembly factor-like uncharacterized protein
VLYKSILTLSVFGKVNFIVFDCYFIGTNEHQEHFLYATTDFGVSWINRAQGVSSYYFLDENTVYAIIKDDMSTNVMKSADCGLTWEIKSAFNLGRVDNIYFNTNDIGFIVGATNMSLGIKIISKTIDGGENWIWQKFTLPLYDVYFIDKNKGFTGGGFTSRHCITRRGQFVTNDGGKTWNRFNDGLWLRSCYFVNENVGFITGRLTINKTIDSGNNWIGVYESNFDSTGYAFSVEDLFFFNEQIGWSVGSSSWVNDSSGAAILGTKDGGENWDLIWKHPDTDLYEYSLNSIHAVKTTAWAVGETGLIVKYTEQDQWQLMTRLTDLPLNDVFFNDEYHGWIAGGYLNDQNIQSILLKTRDGGFTWQENSYSAYLINEMYFADNLHGWAVGNDTSYSGAIIDTDDGGDNWTVQVEGLSAPLNAIHFKDGYGWAVGGNGLVLRYDGETWIDENNRKIYPNNFKLSQNYPNPFNPSTKIKFTLPKADKVKIELYNTLGQRVETLLKQNMKAGYHEVEFNAQNLSSGIYFYRIKAGEFQDVKKMVLLR